MTGDDRELLTARQFGRELLKDVQRGVVDERMDGVKPKPVDVEVAHPAQCAFDDVGPHLVGVRSAQVDALTHGLLTAERYGPNLGR